MSTAVQHRPTLCCPSCDQSLAPGDEALHCPSCSESVPIVDGVPRFPVPVDDTPGSDVFEVLSPIYETPLWFPVVYRLIGGPFAPIDDRSTIADLLDAGDGDVLDVACGTGRVTRYVANEAAFVWGIDVSEEMLAKGRQYADRDGVENAAVARMDATDLRFSDDRFDSVACCWALHLFPDIPEALGEIARVLKPGGTFAGTTVTDDSVLSAPGVRFGLQQTIDPHVFDRDELRGLLRDAGFASAGFEQRGAALFFKATT